MSYSIKDLVDAIATAPTSDARHQLGKLLLAELDMRDKEMREEQNVVVVNSTVLLVAFAFWVALMVAVGYALSKM